MIVPIWINGIAYLPAVECETRVNILEAALQLIGNELSLHADKGPAGEAFRSLLNPTLPETSPKYGTCPECGGMGGAHLTSCRHSPTQAETKDE